MHFNTHDVQTVKSIKFNFQGKNVKKRIKIKTTFMPLHSKKQIFKRRSTKDHHENIHTQSKHKISCNENQRCKTLPKLMTSFSKNQNPQKQLSKNIYDSLVVSTKNWCLYDSTRNEYFGFRQDYRRQIASLTKIMTTFLSISHIQKLNISLSTLVRVTKNAAEMIGTTANLKEQSWASLEDLLYGTMLPSGNDAAYTLAQYVGYLLNFSQSGRPSKHKKLDLTKMNTNGYVQEFVYEMNKRAYALELYNTRFSNPHGLQNALNTSSAKDIVKLCQVATKNRLFSTIMNTRYYKYEVYEGDEPKQISLKRWWNTNKLLQKDWEGIKTGQTTSAGGCLSSLKQGILITVLNSSNAESRFTDTEKIFSWYKTHHSEASSPKSSFQIIKKCEIKPDRSYQTQASL